MSQSRTFDGSGNNLANGNWGRAGTQLLRFTPASYYGGGAAPSGSDRPNPREISNIVCRDTSGSGQLNTNKLSHFVWAWGQFLDHEIDLSTESETEAFNFDVPDLPGTQIEFRRSTFDPTTGTSLQNPRQQINVLSAYVDGSNVYGSSDVRAEALRTKLDGKLKTSEPAGVESRELLPFNDGGLPNAQMGKANWYVAGDVRVNEHSVLICMHTLFVREHNRLCDELVDLNGPYKNFAKHIDELGDPEQSPAVAARRDHEVFEMARRIVGAITQVITYEEFLPALLGKNALAPYQGYNSRVNASIANIFSTAAYRLGHSMLPKDIPLINEKGVTTRLGFDKLFFTPSLIAKHGVDVFMRGLASERMQEIDNLTVEPIRSALFKNRSGHLNDLAALNIQRGRDHGLPDYLTCRAAYNLPKKTEFSQISRNSDTADRLEKAYGDIGLIDPWIGAISEDHVWHVAGRVVQKRQRGAFQAAVGELVFAVLKDQFERLRDGDRFWYENDPAFDSRMISQLKRTRLSTIIARNTGFDNPPRDVFRV